MKTFKHEKPTIIIGVWCLFNYRFFLWTYLRIFKDWKLCHGPYGYDDIWLEHKRTGK